MTSTELRDLFEGLFLTQGCCPPQLVLETWSMISGKLMNHAHELAAFERDLHGLHEVSILELCCRIDEEVTDSLEVLRMTGRIVGQLSRLWISLDRQVQAGYFLRVASLPYVVSARLEKHRV